MGKIRDILKKRLFILAEFFKRNKKYRWLIIVILFLMAILLYLAIAPLGVSREAVALAELEKTFNQDIICHEKCLLFRRVRENMLASSLKRRETKTIKLFNKLWIREDLSSDFRRESVRIIYLGYGDSSYPAYLKEYLIKDQADPIVMREIIIRFPLIVQGYGEFRDKLAERLSKANSTEERIELLKIIREISNDAEIDNYFAVLTANEEEDFKREAVKNISNIKDKATYFKIEQLEIIRELALKDDTPNSLRRDLALLIGDYYLIFPNQAMALWEDVCDQEDLDAITRLFSADNLNHLGGRSVPLPEVSAEEWAEYYN